jgi:hypothetical protein
MPVGADVQLFIAPPETWICPTTSHSGALSTPFPLNCSALEQSESTCTVPFVLTAEPGEPVILFSPQACGARASSEYGNGMSLPLVATPMAPVRCTATPSTPWKKEGRDAFTVTWMWSARPLKLDGAMGGMSTRTVLPPTPFSKPLSFATWHAASTGRGKPLNGDAHTP